MVFFGCNALSQWRTRYGRVIWMGGLVSALLVSTTWAELPTSMRASTSLESRQEVIKSLPLDQLTAAKRQQIEAVLNKPSIYRRMPVQLTATDPQMFTFLVRHPEVVINMWQLMGATRIQFQRTGAYTSQMNDGAGTSSRIELVYGTPDLHVFYAEGFYDGPLVPGRLEGKCVLVLTTGSSSQRGETFLSTRLDVFLQVDRRGVELLAKTLHPLVGGTVDKNYTDTIRFVSQLSRATARNRAGIERLTARLTLVDPAVRAQFNKITARVSEAARGQLVAKPLPATAGPRRE